MLNDFKKAASQMALVAALTLTRFFTKEHLQTGLPNARTGADGTPGRHATKRRFTRMQRKRKAQLRRSAQQVQRRLSWARV